jgi:hypothetical protein
VSTVVDRPLRGSSSVPSSFWLVSRLCSKGSWSSGIEGVDSELADSGGDSTGSTTDRVETAPLLDGRVGVTMLEIGGAGGGGETGEEEWSLVLEAVVKVSKSR